MRRIVMAGVVLLLVACTAGLPQAIFGSTSLPPLAADRARLYFYRDYEPSESLAEPWIYLNGQPTVLSIPGHASYRDVLPGEYRITVDSHGVYPNQFKTIRLSAGEEAFVKIESLASWDQGLTWAHDTFVVALIDPPEGKAELLGMRYAAGTP